MSTGLDPGVLALLNSSNRVLGLPRLPGVLAAPPAPVFKPPKMPTVGVGKAVNPNSPVGVIVKNARRFGLDPAAVIAYALEESNARWGAVGDKGTSFGPFQAHIGGAAGSRSPQSASQWANSPEGLIQMMGMMSRTPIRGKAGEDAVRAIYQYFGKGTPAAVPKGLARYREAQLLASGHAAEYVQEGNPVPTGSWAYPQMVTGVPNQGYSNLNFAGHTDYVHVDTTLLQKLNQLGRLLGVKIQVISGYRAPGYSASVGGYANDPHARGVAVDAYINGVPIGSYKGAVATLKQLGLESGAQPGFYRGKSDPEHVQVPGSGVNKRIHARHTLR